jgi:hypothetical protein
MMSYSKMRLSLLNSHFTSNLTVAQAAVVVNEGRQYLEVIDHKPHLKTRIDYMNRQGWGYADTALVLDPTKDMLYLKGNRYLFSGQFMPDFKKWAEEFAHLNFSNKSPK